MILEVRNFLIAHVEVYRVEWNEINSEKGKQIMKEKIDKFLNFIKLNKSWDMGINPTCAEANSQTSKW